MGIVYEAQDNERGRRVALKTLKKYDLDRLYRFKREFRSLADLSHPNLINLYELFVDDTRCFFTMELIEGVDVLRFCRPNVDRSIVARSGSQIETSPGWEFQGESPGAAEGCDEERLRATLPGLVAGLMALHDAGLVHRDIKPSNVVVTDDGRVVLLDFGLVTELSTSTSDSLAGHIVGTVEYMAPEQAASEELTPAADWYALGVLIFEALTGTVPFSGSVMQVVIAKQQGKAPAPLSLVPSVSQDLSDLAVALMSPEPSERPDGKAVLDALGISSGAPRRRSSIVDFAPFSGRTGELTQLHECFEDVENRDAAAALIRGASGMGKSALVRRFLRSLRRRNVDLVVLEGRCYESETVPYKAIDSVIDQLSRYWSQLPRPEAAELLPKNASLLARLFPMLGRVPAVAGSPRQSATGDPHQLRSDAFAALRDVLTRLGQRRRLVVFVDDLQWGDSDSVALLSDLMRPPDPPPLLLLLASRDETTVVEDILDGLECPLLNLEIGPLDEEDAVSLAQAALRTADRGEAKRIAEEASRIPFFIRELALYQQTVGDEERSGPTSLEDVLRARVDQLDDDQRHLLETVAIAAEPISVRVLATAVDREKADLGGMVRHLRTVNFLKAPRGPASDRVECYHDRIRTSVRSAVSNERRSEVHRNLAVALERWEEGSPERLARHWSGAGEPLHAAEYAERAARDAAEKVDFDRASRLYRLALELGEYEGDEARRMQKSLGEAMINAGRPLHAAYAFNQAAEGTDPATALELRRRAAGALLRGGHIRRGMKWLEAVLSAVGMKLAATPTRALWSAIWRRAWLRVRGTRWKERRESEIPRETIVKIDAAASVSSSLAMMDTFRGADYQARHLLMALRAGERTRVARALAVESVYLVALGKYPRARRLVEMAAELSDETTTAGDQPIIPFILWTRGAEAFYRTNDWRAALEQFERAASVLREHHQSLGWELDTVQHFIWTTKLNLGEIADTSRRVRRAIRAAERRADLWAAVNLRARMNLLWLAKDDPADALRQIELGEKAWVDIGDAMQVQHYWFMLSRVELALYQGEAAIAAEAFSCKEAKLRKSLLLRVPMVRVEVFYLCGRIELALGAASADAKQRRHHGKEANRCAGQLEGICPLADGFALLLRAGAAALANDRAETTKQLRDAIGAFEGIETKLWANVARRRLGEVQRDDVLVQNADRWLSEQQVRNPANMSRLLAPACEISD
jgi:hypothetical protein